MKSLFKKGFPAMVWFLTGIYWSMASECEQSSTSAEQDKNPWETVSKSLTSLLCWKIFVLPIVCEGCERIKFWTYFLTDSSFFVHHSLFVDSPKSHCPQTFVSSHFVFNVSYPCRPDLKPVEIEPEVVLKLPECDKLNSTVLRLDEVT